MRWVGSERVRWGVRWLDSEREAACLRSPPGGGAVTRGGRLVVGRSCTASASLKGAPGGRFLVGLFGLLGAPILVRCLGVSCPRAARRALPAARSVGRTTCAASSLSRGVLVGAYFVRLECGARGGCRTTCAGLRWAISSSTATSRASSPPRYPLHAARNPTPAGHALRPVRAA